MPLSVAKASDEAARTLRAAVEAGEGVSGSLRREVTELTEALAKEKHTAKADREKEAAVRAEAEARMTLEVRLARDGLLLLGLPFSLRAPRVTTLLALLSRLIA